MRRRMMKSKIHRATVTDANLNYVGSITLDPLLMAEADVLEHSYGRLVRKGDLIERTDDLVRVGVVPRRKRNGRAGREGRAVRPLAPKRHRSSGRHARRVWRDQLGIRRDFQGVLPSESKALG